MIYFNNEFTVDESIANNMGFNYGIGCFETLMGIGRKVIFLEEHLKRLKNSKEYLGIAREYNWYGIIGELIRFENISETDEYSLKILVTDKDIMIVLKRIKLRVEPLGIKVKIIREFYQNEFGFIKSTNYAVNIMAKQNIKKDGFYEGIFKNRCNVVTEGTISNLFFTKKDKLYTPALRLNILPGIVRQKVIEIANKRGVKVEEGEYNEEEILGADSIFITNSLMKNGILWVSEIEGIKNAKGKIEELIEVEYGKIIKD